MNLHEYQAKQLLAEFGLPVPAGEVAWNAEDAVGIAEKLGGDAWVVKAQVHAGGRGKAGGVKIVQNIDTLKQAVQGMLGKRLVTYQTDANGQPINSVLIAKPCEIKKELYLSAVIDRSSRRIVIMASTEGGVEIEKIAEETPEKILRETVDPLLGVLPYQARDIGFKLGLNGEQIKQFTQIMCGLGKLFTEKDLALLEINPLVIDDHDNLICLDAKISLDENALYRQPEIRSMRDTSQEDDRENRARDWSLNYIALDGDVGCMVNGAGLAMATMDIIKLHGGNPANFLDVGGSATTERVTEAFKIILSDQHVKGVLVNIFGGIVRCDLIADGIIEAVKGVGVKIPVVVRLEGNNAEQGLKKLEKSGLNIIPADSLTDAAKKIVNEVRG
ncbi:MAG: ADP-forming succinate--CoA ligase subunit beta, partial [Gammaproteobacteria bacterium]